MSRRKQPRRPKAVKGIDHAIRLAKQQGSFEGVAHSTITYAAQRGYAVPNPTGTGWVLTPQGRAYSPPTT